MSEVSIPTAIGQFTFIEKIGAGSFAEVWTARHQKTQKIVAIKIISKEKFKEQKHFTRFNREVAFMRQVEHPLIAQLFQVLEDEKNHYLVMEYCSGENLLQYINTDGKLEENLARQYFIQLFSVIEYLHKEKSIIHRDLKAENVLLDRNYNIRLIDFGLSNSFSFEKQNLETACGSPGYLPPEMIKGQTHTTAADIWSLGVLLYCITVGRLPFDDPNMQTILNKIVNTQPFFPRTLSADLLSLLKKMLVKDPEQRITLDEIKEHPWFSKDVYKYLSERLVRTLPQVPPEHPVIADFQIKESVVKEMEKLGYNVDGIDKRLMSRDFDDVTAAYLILSKELLTDEYKDIRDVGIRLDGKRVESFKRCRSPSFGSTGFLSVQSEGRSLIAPRVGTRPRLPPRANSTTMQPPI